MKMKYLLIVVGVLICLVCLPITGIGWLIMRIGMVFARPENEDVDRTTLYSPGKMW